jgi:hypothetical protein
LGVDLFFEIKNPASAGFLMGIFLSVLLLPYDPKGMEVKPFCDKSANRF